MKKIPRPIWFSMLYAVCLLLIYPIVWNMFWPPVSSNFWFTVLIRFSGPVLLYLGLVLQRTRKPVPIPRKVMGIVIFLIGFGWLFSWMRNRF